MKLADWARLEGIDYKTAYRWFRDGIIPYPTIQLPTGTILVQKPEKSATTKNTALYARVSSSDQKGDLERQLGRLVSYATTNNLNIVGSVTEVGSGLNGKRSKLIGLLERSDIDVIVVEHRDRLTRFGFEYLQASLKANDREIVVLEESELTSDLVKDMIDVLTSFCARLYGQRSARNKAKKLLKDLEKENTVAPEKTND
jgi:predicted site-specific integrase-resolvase